MEKNRSGFHRLKYSKEKVELDWTHIQKSCHAHQASLEMEPTRKRGHPKNSWRRGVQAERSRSWLNRRDPEKLPATVKKKKKLPTTK